MSSMDQKVSGNQNELNQKFVQDIVKQVKSNIDASNRSQRWVIAIATGIIVATCGIIIGLITSDINQLQSDVSMLIGDVGEIKGFLDAIKGSILNGNK